MIRLVLPLAGALAAAACVPAAGLPDVSEGTGVRFDCDDGSTVLADIGSGSTTVSLADGTNFRLPLVGSSAGGRQYAADGVVWFLRGDEAVFTERGGQLNCRRAAF
ncbi:MliC family protein [Jannaschia sp. W003]|uniref:MliC family protein n=1 Tax=Jannaschia sp. W003 TaxID=2867012 RepID=UPI0021A3D556|nr:MliC family protein [Jannaschia sp. W003]UWQ20995.1 MliC family protein [Jannaschia sp. W003]